MGLFLTLLTLPVSGPVGGTIWIAEQVRAAAEGERYGEAAVHQELMDLEYWYERGELTDVEFDEAADVLLERLMAESELQAAHGDDVDGDDIDEVVVDEESGDA
jgi:Gas vesicle protein G